MMLYTSAQSDLDADSNPNSNSRRSFVLERILPTGMLGCSIAFVAARMSSNLTHVNTGEYVTAVTAVFMASAQLYDRLSCHYEERLRRQRQQQKQQIQHRRQTTWTAGGTA